MPPFDDPRDPLGSRWEQRNRDFDRDFTRTKRFAMIGLVFWLVVLGALTATAIWAIVELANWITR